MQPIKTVVCPEKSLTEGFFGSLYISVRTRPVWLMSSEVDCDQWSGRSNPTRMAMVGPSQKGVLTPEGWTNPFRLEARGSRAAWRLRVVKRAPDGSFRKLFAFRVIFAPWPRRTGYRGLFLCFSNDCSNITRPPACPPDDLTTLNCGTAPGPPLQVNPFRWFQMGSTFRFRPAVAGFKPFLVYTENWRNTETKRPGFHLHIEENPRIG